VLAPWILASVGSAVASLLVVSIAQRASAHLLDGVGDAELQEAVVRQIGAMKRIGVVAAPAAVLARWAGTAALLWSVATLASSSVRYRTVLSIVACAGLPEVLGRGVDLAAAWSEGPEFTTGLVPMSSCATSLAAFLPASPGPWGVALLDRLTPFTLWCGALWVTGLVEVAGFGIGRAVAVAVPVWTALALGEAALAVLRGSVVGFAGVGLG
jgi:hypothetical protein